MCGLELPCRLKVHTLALSNYVTACLFVRLFACLFVCSFVCLFIGVSVNAVATLLRTSERTGANFINLNNSFSASSCVHVCFFH